MSPASEAGPTRPSGDARRRALTRAAFNQIAERGFEGLRTREVAAEVGLNIATLHYYFPTKEALIGGVVELAMERFRSTLDFQGPPADHLRNHLRAVHRLLREEPELGAVMAELALRSARDPAIAAITSRTGDAWLRTLRAMLRKGVREGTLRPELDSADVAALIATTLTSMTLPAAGSATRSDLALRQLERWLGLASPRRKPAS